MWIPELNRDLTGRLLAIWEGRAEGLTPERMEAYRRVWRGETKAATPDRPRIVVAVTQAGGRVTAEPVGKAGGPGTELKKLLAELGLTAATGCGCDDYARKMDAWGPRGCRDRKDEIAAHLKGQAARLGWAEYAGVVRRAVTQGIVLNPLDIYGSLVELACARAEARA